MDSVKSCRLVTDVSELWFSLLCDTQKNSIKLLLVRGKGYSAVNAFILKAVLNSEQNAAQSCFHIVIHGG